MKPFWPFWVSVNFILNALYYIVHLEVSLGFVFYVALFSAVWYAVLVSMGKD